jgi:hypothetical protein
VYIEIRKNYFPGTRKIDFVDTAGYDVVIRNDSIKLFWFIDFEFDLKCTRIEEMTFEKHEFFIEEGKKIRRGLK